MYWGEVMWIRLTATILTLTLVVGSVAYAYNRGRQSGMQQVQTLWDLEKAAIMQANIEETMKARQRESALHDLVAKLKKEKRDESLRLSRQYAADLERLRDRPDTRAGAGGVPEGAAAGVGCTGEGLSRADSEFLVGLAADAARTQNALKTCVRAYNSVMSQLNERKD